MIGTTLKAKSPIPLGSYVSMIVAALLIVLAVTIGEDVGFKHLTLAAIWPFCLSLILFIMTRRRFHVEICEKHLHVTEPHHEEIPYASFLAVQRDNQGTAKRRALFVHHQQGVLAIPDRVGIPSGELLLFLQEWIPPGRREDLPDELQHHLDAFRNKFGSDRVFAFTPRHVPTRGTYGRFGRALGLTCMLAGILWPIVATLFEDRKFKSEGWISSGVSLFFVGAIFYWLFAMLRRLPGGQKKWHHSGLVISPLGLSVIQGKLRGEMRWDELKKLEYPVKKKFFDVAANNKVGGIYLDFGGGGVNLLDIYCHPLQVIHDRMKAYWQG